MVQPNKNKSFAQAIYSIIKLFLKTIIEFILN